MTAVSAVRASVGDARRSDLGVSISALFLWFAAAAFLAGRRQPRIADLSVHRR